MAKKVRKCYRFACWGEFPELRRGYHVHLYVRLWLFWLGWLLRRIVIVAVEETNDRVERIEFTSLEANDDQS